MRRELNEIRRALENRRWEEVLSMCTTELAHYLWSRLCNAEIDSDGMRGDENEGAFATIYVDNCEYCDVCETRVKRLAYE